MQEVKRYQIRGAEIKREKNGHLIIGFSSRIVADEQLEGLKNMGEKFFLAFYGCNLSKSNLETLVQIGVSELGIFHSSFADADLVLLSQSQSLEHLKLHDTAVTQACINEIQKQRPQLRIFN